MNAVEICNLALDALKKSPIADLSEATREATVCARYYSPTLLAELRRVDWNFNRGIISAASLVTVASQLPPGWAYRYAYPTDAVRVWGVLEDPRVRPVQKFMIATNDTVEGRVIFANLSPCWFRYGRAITDPTNFDQTFVEAFSFLLASRMAMALTGDSKNIKNMLALYKDAIDQAEVSNANEGGPDVIGGGPEDVPNWLAARGETG